jgi:hypothetical protein
MSGVLLIEYDIMTNVHPCFCGVRVARSLVLCVCFVDRCLSFCTFSFGHCVVCPSFGQNTRHVTCLYIQRTLRYQCQRNCLEVIGFSMDNKHLIDQDVVLWYRMSRFPLSIYIYNAIKYLIHIWDLKTYF